jgi:hypothetical protein
MRRSVFSVIPNLEGDLGKLQQAILDAFERVAQLAAGKNSRNADNAYVSSSLAVGDTTLEHGLGRTPVGWAIVDRSAATDIYRTSWNATNLVLNSSATATVKVEVW